LLKFVSLLTTKKHITNLGVCVLKEAALDLILTSLKSTHEKTLLTRNKNTCTLWKYNSYLSTSRLPSFWKPKPNNEALSSWHPMVGHMDKLLDLFLQWIIHPSIQNEVSSIASSLTKNVQNVHRSLSSNQSCDSHSRTRATSYANYHIYEFSLDLIFILLDKALYLLETHSQDIHQWVICRVDSFVTLSPHSISLQFSAKTSALQHWHFWGH
jgi:hypothetical protein